MAFISYDEKILSMSGLQGHYRLDASANPMVDLGPHKTDFNMPFGDFRARHIVPAESNVFFTGDESITHTVTKDTINATESDPAIANINTAQAFTLLLWFNSPNNGGSNALNEGLRTKHADGSTDEIWMYYTGQNWYWQVDDVNSQVPFAPIANTPSLLAITTDGVDMQMWVNNSVIETRARAWADLDLIRMLTSDVGNGSGSTQSFGHFSIFNRVLSASELSDLYEKRRFTAQIAGTATLDGSATAATVRAFRRSDGQFSGETVAAADGTYELILTDNTEMDILALPPSGVAARPLAHGPILPDPYNQ